MSEYWDAIDEHVSDLPEEFDEDDEDEMQLSLVVMLNNTRRLFIGAKSSTDCRWWAFG
jgi:hypothetical protein